MEQNQKDTTDQMEVQLDENLSQEEDVEETSDIVNEEVDEVSDEIEEDIIDEETTEEIEDIELDEEDKNVLVNIFDTAPIIEEAFGELVKLTKSGRISNRILKMFAKGMDELVEYGAFHESYTRQQKEDGMNNKKEDSNTVVEQITEEVSKSKKDTTPTTKKEQPITEPSMEPQNQEQSKEDAVQEAITEISDRAEAILNAEKNDVTETKDLISDIDKALEVIPKKHYSELRQLQSYLKMKVTGSYDKLDNREREKLAQQLIN